MNKKFIVTKDRENDFESGILNQRIEKGNILNLNENCCDTETFYSFDSHKKNYDFCEEMKMNKSYQKCENLILVNLKDDLLLNHNIDLYTNINLKSTEKVKMLFLFFPISYI